MSPSGSIEVAHVWKRFRAERTPRQIRGMLAKRRLDRERPKDKSRQRHRWALRDIGFSAQPGESLGLIGRNGSGKSTLLKILGRVMYPYAGSATVTGRIGALIEVRAGIHPELTGRENVQMYGSLLGLGRREVMQRFDEIIEFAEVEDAVERQVKFYSSGMQMRLGFAVAAFLEPDVLLVDEVLAVGDANFQQKCLDRMRAVLEQGTTLVLVSHDLAAVESTCERAVWLDDGLLRLDGDSREVVGAYRRAVEEMVEHGQPMDTPVRMLKAEIEGGGANSDGPLEIRLRLDAPSEYTRGMLVIGISEGTPSPIILASETIPLSRDGVDVRCRIDRLPVTAGQYYLWVGVFRKNRDLMPWHPVARFEVSGAKLYPAPSAIVRLAPIATSASFEVDMG